MLKELRDMCVSSNHQDLDEYRGQFLSAGDPAANQNDVASFHLDLLGCCHSRSGLRISFEIDSAVYRILYHDGCTLHE